MLFNKNDHGHNTFQASPAEVGWEFRIAEPRGTYYPVHLSTEDAWRLVQLIQDVEQVRRQALDAREAIPVVRRMRNALSDLASDRVDDEATLAMLDGSEFLVRHAAPGEEI